MPMIKELVSEPDKPILVNFENGQIQTVQDNSLCTTLFMQDSKKRIGVGIGNSDMLYTGEVADDVEYNCFLVLQHPDSQESQLIQIDECTVAPVQKDSSTASSVLPLTNTSLANLKKEFGSKKAKRYTQQQEKLTMNIESVKDHLGETVADIVVPEAPVSMHDEGDSLYTPKINRDASLKEHVYELADLVPLEVLNSLEDKVSEILESEDFASYELIPAVQKSMLNVLSSYPEKVAFEKCKILLYTHYLIKFIITPLKSMTKKFIVCDCSEQVDKHIKQNYTVNGMRPLSFRDKAMSYVIVLFMIAMNYEVNLEEISKDLKTGLKKMQEFSRVLGFSQSTKDKNIITLKIPVPPPVRANLKRKRNN